MRACCDPPAPATEIAPPARGTAGDARGVLTVALAGNPNCGKTTIFNALTGARQHVGNWPGKTIERREGRFALADGREVALIDLPGTYSLSAFSAEEIVAMDYLLGGEADVVVAVLDAGNLERNLYLTAQLVEMGLPLVVLLNMMDAAEGRGLGIDAACLSEWLGGVPVIPAVARAGRGLGALKEALAEAWARGASPAAATGGPVVGYAPEVEAELVRLEAQVRAAPEAAWAAPRWLAVRLLEGDAHVQQRLDGVRGAEELIAAAEAAAGRLARRLGEEADLLITDGRYAFANRVVRDSVQRSAHEPRTFSDRVDSIATHPVLGLPVFAAIMWLVFQMTANISAYYVDWIDGVINGVLARRVADLLGAVGLGGTWVESLAVEGVIAGVGGVLVFVPVLGFMYLFIAVLEDTGYMARAAFLMDRFMHLIGLHGKSFIPMLLGFGCSVPGIYATRTLDNPRDRLLTALLVPFMSCGARLPVYMVIGAAFFGAQAGTLVFAMYVLGVVAAIALGLLLKHTLFRTGEEAPFVMELPPYRVPSPRSLMLHTWERTRGFVENATTVILAATVVVWLLLAVPVGAGGDARFAAVEPESSLLATVSQWMAPAFEPAGFGTWQSASSLVTGFIAKEVIVSTLSVVYVGEDVTAAAGEAAPPSVWADLASIGTTFASATWDALRATASLLPGVNLMGAEPAEAGTGTLEGALRGAFTPLGAVAFCVFVLLMAPCVTTLSALRHEFGTKWMAFSTGMMLAVAWAAAVIVFQGGRLLGLG